MSTDSTISQYFHRIVDSLFGTHTVSVILTFEPSSFILLSMKSLMVLPLSKMLMSQFSAEKTFITDPEVTGAAKDDKQ